MENVVVSVRQDYARGEFAFVCAFIFTGLNGFVDSLCLPLDALLHSVVQDLTDVLFESVRKIIGKILFKRSDLAKKMPFEAELVEVSSVDVQHCRCAFRWIFIDGLSQSFVTVFKTGGSSFDFFDINFHFKPS